MRTERQIIRKDLKANMEEIFLRNILRGPVHGYKLIIELKQDYGIPFGPSEVYPLLHELEEKGYVSSRREYPDNDRPRRVYYSVPVKTAGRLKKIIDIKNQNRRAINRKSNESLTVQLCEPLVIR